MLPIFIAGTYTPEMIQDVRHNRQGVILIANDSKGEDLKEQMLKLFGLYVDKGYYKVSFPREQRYAYYDVNDPDALKKLCGTGGLIPNTRDMFSAPGPTDDPSAPEVTAAGIACYEENLYQQPVFMFILATTNII